MACTSTRPDVGREAGPSLSVEPTADAPPRGCDTPETISEDAMVEDTVPETAGVSSSQPTSAPPIVETSQPSVLNVTGASEATTKNRSSRFRGVCWNKKNKRWQSAINNGGRYIYLGSFTSDIEAARAFDLAALQIRGRDTKLNFSVEDYPESEWKGGAPPHLAEKYMSGAVRPKPAPFRQFTGTPSKIFNPHQFASIQVPFKRGRFEEAGLGKTAFDRAERRFLSSAFFTTPAVAGMPKIKQEFPQAHMAAEAAFGKVESLTSPFEKAPSFFLPSGISSTGVQASSAIKTPSITTPSFGGRLKGPFDPSLDFGKKEGAFRNILPDRMDDSAETKVGLAPSVACQLPLKRPATHMLDRASFSDRFPVPILHSANQDEPSVHVSSVISETVAGSDIEEAKSASLGGMPLYGMAPLCILWASTLLKKMPRWPVRQPASGRGAFSCGVIEIPLCTQRPKGREAEPSGAPSGSDTNVMDSVIGMATFVSCSTTDDDDL